MCGHIAILVGHYSILVGKCPMSDSNFHHCSCIIITLTKLTTEFGRSFVQNVIFYT